MSLPLLAVLAIGASVLALGLVALARARRALRSIRQRLARYDASVGQLDAVERRVEALGHSVGVLTNDLTRRFDALGHAAGVHANNTDNRLDALSAASSELTRRTKEIEDRVGAIHAVVGITQAAVRADSLGEFLAPFDWATAIAEAATRRPAPVAAVAFIRRRSTGSQPVDLRCADGAVYVVKGVQIDRPAVGRRVFTEHVVGRLGLLIGAPVPRSTLVLVPPDLIARHPDAHQGMGHLQPGLAHGSRYSEGLGERCDDIMHVDANRRRFATLAILHGWAQSSDRHFLYDAQPPHRVYSTDHEGCFAGGPDWTADGLQRASTAHLAADLVDACSLTHADLAAAAAPLAAVTAQEIAEILAVPPDEWGVTLDERVKVGHYLRLRQFHLLAMYGPLKSDSHLRADGADPRN